MSFVVAVASVDRLTLLVDDVGGIRALKKFIIDSDEAHACEFTSFSNMFLICGSKNSKVT